MMRKALFIYNPIAGKKAVVPQLDYLFRYFQGNGWRLYPYRTTGKEDDLFLVKLLEQENFDSVIVSGGDGTLHRAANGILRSGLDLPLGIIPSGTSNDFAAHLNLPQNIESCCDVIVNGKLAKLDLGWASGSYFINVASAGLLSDIPHKTDIAMKNVMGKLAYYLKGIENIPNFRAIPLEIQAGRRVFNEDALLFLVVNGNTAGGFSRLAPRASIVDGKFDVIVIKPCNLGQMFGLFLKLFKGEHINDPRVEYFQTSHLTIDCPLHVDTDLDGEPGPRFPLEIKVLSRRLPVYIPKRILPSSRRMVSSGELF